VPFLAQNQDIPDALVSELLTRYSTQQGYTLFSDVIPFFNMLKDRSDQRPDHLRWPWERTVVGIISNSDDRVLSVLQSFGLKIRPQRVGMPGECRVQADMDDDITFIVLSYDAGFEKPDRRIFDAARQMLEKSIAKNCRSDGPVSIRDFTRLYVGDSLEHDYFGAKEAGWDAVLVDRSKGPPLEVDQNWQETSLPGLYREDRNVDGIAKEVVTCDHLVSLAGWQPGELERMKKRVQKNS
jgi:FMN phosphatase YigB (HAD superfamily)